MSQPIPHHAGRTLTAPDGTRVHVAFTGTRPVYMTAAELLAATCPDLAPSTPQPHRAADRGAPVIDLAVERLKRHRPGTPYTADEIAPILTPRGRALAPGIAEVMNELAFRGRPCDRP
ncbi:hypothetical protein [Streptomyces sp. DSM 41534]